MEIRLEFESQNESPLSFINSLQQFLKQKIEKKDLASIEISTPADTETTYNILYAEENPEVVKNDST